MKKRRKRRKKKKNKESNNGDNNLLVLGELVTRAEREKGFFVFCFVLSCISGACEHFLLLRGFLPLPWLSPVGFQEVL